MNYLTKIWNTITKIWKDSVWSKVISAGIILIIVALWTKFSNYSGEEIYSFVICVLKMEIPVFIVLSLIGLYFLIKIISQLFKRKTDTIWDEQIGNYKFKELHQILSNQNFPFKTVGMKWSGIKPPEDDLLTLFYTYSTFLNKGIDLEDNLDDGGYLFGVLAPKLVGYGLVDKIETKNLQIDVMDTKYQTSELGHKFYALLEKTIHLKPKK